MTNSNKTICVVWTGKEKQIIKKINLSKEGQDVQILVLLLGKRDQKVNVDIFVNHAKSRTQSRVVVKGVLFDRAQAEVNGRVSIEKGAVDSKAWLEAKLLLLSEKASGRVEPNLEICENEVVAGHATTVGQVNEEELFYLMSRGLPTETATRLLVRGFLSSILAEFPSSYKIYEKLEKRLSHI